MSDPDLDMHLRDGLRQLPTPTVSADFDARVLAALHQPLRWPQALWLTLRPLLTSAACSLVLTLTVLAWMLHTPALRPASPVSPSTVRPLNMAALDELLSRPDLSAASVAMLLHSPPLMPAPAPARPPDRPHRVSRVPQALLTA